MGLHLRNSLTGELEAFEPHDEVVTLYYCGLTVSDAAHLGHARSWVHVDVLRRWLEASGYTVRHVENFTDVNEKIVARIGERPEWDDERAVAEHFIEQVLADMRRLNCRRASVYPRVSDHIEAIIDLIQRLLDAGHAYEANGSVYFDVPAFADYGQLVDPDLDADGDDHPDKRHPADFALWKAGGVDPEDVAEHVTDDAVDLAAACDGAMTWSSPWGTGRPGWHIECSAMSTEHLGETFDLHVAGQDIIFPHNENEIAQAEAATGQPYARYWMHVGLLEIDEEKMSSSLANFRTAESAIESHGADVIRTFLLSAGYDARQTFTASAIEEARQRYERLDRAYEAATAALDSPAASAVVADETLRSAVETTTASATDALDDNLDTRGALVALESLAGDVQSHLDGAGPFDYVGLLDAIGVFASIGSAVLGLTFGDGAGARDDHLDGLLDELLELRESLREAGEYEVADAIRDRFAAHGVEIEDTDAGPRARRP